MASCPAFRSIFFQLQPSLPQLTTHIHFTQAASHRSWLQQDPRNFWAFLIAHSAVGHSTRQDWGVFNSFLHELQMIYIPYLRQLHLLPFERNPGKTIHFANYEICVK